MHQSLAPARPQSSGSPATRTALRSSPPPGQAARSPAIATAPTGRGFRAILAAFKATGGIARGDDVARLLEGHGVDDFIGLARLIAARDVLGFEWRHTLWIPMFQFDLRDLSIKPAAQRVLKELGTGFDAWACAAWLATPNSWLDHHLPVDLLDTQLTRVLEAARADRFIAVG